VVVTPSSLGYEEMTLDDLVVVDLEGNVVSGTRSATSEKGVHLAAFAAFPEVGGVVHCHAVHASMYAVSHRPIPAAIDEFVVYIGGDVPVGAYHPSGSDGLSVEVAGHLHDRSAVLMANHGLVTIGKSVEDALHSALVVEHNAKIMWGAQQLGGIVGLPFKAVRDFTNVYSYIRTETWNPAG
jgi:L-fuculose-phosphate aldolase